MQSKPRSFVLRKGRITSAQQDALTNLWSTYVLEDTSDKLDLKAVFKNNNPVVVDIGFGSGETLLHFAKNNPHKNFLGIEVYLSGIGSSLSKAGLSDLSNLRIINKDAEIVFKENISIKSLEGVILFYPDPWPKEKASQKTHRTGRFFRFNKLIPNASRFLLLQNGLGGLRKTHF